MPMDRFIIAPFNSGLQTDLKPWLIPDDAFAQLNNAYVFRGSVRKRFGSRLTGSGSSSSTTAPLFSRVRVPLGTLASSVAITAGTLAKIGQMFSVGSQIYTVQALGNPVVMLTTAGAVSIGTTNGAGSAAGITPSANGAIGQTFSIGAQTFTVTLVSGALTTVGPASGTFDTTTGAFTFTGAAANTAILWNSNAVGTFDTTTLAFLFTNTGLSSATPIYFYPSFPIMGLTQYQTGPINQQPSYAFDTRFAYLYSGGAWNRSGTAQWNGGDTNFFWSTTWRGSNAATAVLFTSNFYAVNYNGAGSATDDPIWWTTDGTNWTSGTGANAFYFAPAGGAPRTGPFVKTARIILPYKQNRILLFNTVENNNPGGVGVNTNYVNRCRYSHNGDPFVRNAWYELNQSDNAGGNLANSDGGGFIDAPTTEAIISAEYIKDRVIVYFERSTWELVAQGTSLAPFAWQKINTELGSESQQSSVPFDKVILTVGNTGLHACNGANVERVDNKIPDQIFQIQDKNAGVQRVAGIRDYFTEMVYWTFPADNQRSDQPFPQRVLVYNYKNQSWALNDDCITAFGYFNSQDSQTWATSLMTWQQNGSTWESGTLDAQFRQVIAGNQQGYIFIVDAEATDNARVMQITNVTYDATNQSATLYVNQHTLRAGDYIEIRDVTGISSSLNAIWQVGQIVDANQIRIFSVGTLVGTYTGGGSIARVSQIDIKSKQWNPYDKQGRNVYVAKIDFAVQKTSAGQVTVDYSPSSSNLSMIGQGGTSGTNMLMGTSVLETSPYAIYPLEATQDRLWHPLYLQTDGECIQIRIYLNDTQMRTRTIVYSDFELQGMVLHTMATSDRLQ